MVLDRAFGGRQGVGDLAIVVAAGHQTDDLNLALGEAIGRGATVEARAQTLTGTKESLRHCRVKDGLAGHNRANRGDELLVRDVLQKKA